MELDSISRLSSSFRDPAGAVYRQGSKLFRTIESSYEPHYRHLMSSGLYRELTENQLLVPHLEREGHQDRLQKIIIEPSLIPFISYPYEWSFSALKDAALLTLEIQRIALGFGMSLKDASAYNVQFLGARPIFIDTLSFEMCEKNHPWVAYRQFCQHFLAPLAIACLVDERLALLSRQFMDGVPLNLASRLLPAKTRLSPWLMMHIHLHALGSDYFSERPIDLKRRPLFKNATLALIDSLKKAINTLHLSPKKTEWSDYYQNTNYSDKAFFHKQSLVKEFVQMVRPISVWDLGANNGVFSRISAEYNIPTISFDLDPIAVDQNYRRARADNPAHLLPLIMDLTNPSPDLGFNHSERDSLLKRGPADMALALGLIHHLVISNHTPLEFLASFFADLCRFLVIEFIDPDDSQVKRLMRNKTSLHHPYDEQTFVEQFHKKFIIERRQQIRDSKRVIYLMTRHERACEQ